MKNKILLCILLFIVIVSNIQVTLSQTCTDMMKYWYYRNRLKYFVVPGNKVGESQIVCTRNCLAYDYPPYYEGQPYNNVDFGQHGKHNGLYIGVLATEYYLLYQNGQYEDANNTLLELYYSLNAVRTYWDSLAEPFYGSYTASWDGFFIRGNVPCSFFDDVSDTGFTIYGDSHISLLNSNLSSTDYFYGDPYYTFGNLTDGYYPRGHPSYITHRTSLYCNGGTTGGTPNGPPDFTHPESMSQDEAIIILLGCALAAKMTDDGITNGNDSINSLAIVMTDKIIKELLNIDYQSEGENYCRLYDPAGNKIPGDAGGCTRGYSPGFLESGYQITGDSWYRSQAIWEIFQIVNQIGWQAAIRSASDQDLTATLLALGSYSPGRIAGLTNDKKNWDTFYLLLWEVLNNKTRNDNNQEQLLEKALTQLDAAPCSGPYCYKQDTRHYSSIWPHYLTSIDSDGIYSSGGWATDYRWFKRGNDQDHGDWCTGNYNGLDYMLLYTLYHIMTKDYSPFFVNYNDKKLTDTVSTSTNFVGYNSIYSTQVIKEASVTYKAGDNIHLKAGFHAMAGSNFHAFIGEINCSDGSGYPDSMYTNYYDSLISLPKEPYDVVEDNDTTCEENIYISMPCPVAPIQFEGLFGDSTDYDFTYFWDFGNGDTTSVRSPTLSFDTAGTYHFIVIRTDTACPECYDDSLDYIDTFNIYIVVPNCNIYGTLTENPSCGSAPIEGETLYLTHNGTPVDSVFATTDEDGYFEFVLDTTALNYLDSEYVYTITTASGISIDGMSAQSVQDWIDGSPHSFHYSLGTVDTMWVRRYNGLDSLHDIANAIDLEGNVYVTGTTNTNANNYNMLTIKYSPLGTQLWAKTYTSNNHWDDVARAITVDASGNAYIAGESYPSDAPMITVVKYSAGGTQCWVRTYWRTNTNAKCIQLDNAGKIIVGGTHVITYGAGGNVYTILKYDTAGTLLWTEDYNGTASPPDNSLTSITIDSNNDIYASGSSKNASGNYDMVTVKFDAVDSSKLWVARYDSTDSQNNYAISNTIDGNGNIIVTGFTHLSSGNDEALTISYDPSDGDTNWVRKYNNDAHDFAYKVLYNNAGYIYTAGSTGDASTASMLALKYDTSGTLQWHKNTLSAHPFVFKSAALDQADNLYVTGSTKPTIFSFSDFVTQKLDNAGNVKWTKTYNGTGNSTDIPMQITVSQNGNVYVCGESYGNSTNFDFTTIKYSQCESTDSLLKPVHIAVSQNDSIPVKENSSIQVIPNPNNGNMLIVYELPANTNGTFQVYNLIGDRLFSYPLFAGKNSFTINRSELNQGIYFYRVFTGNKQIAADKIVIIK